MDKQRWNLEEPRQGPTDTRGIQIIWHEWKEKWHTGRARMEKVKSKKLARAGHEASYKPARSERNESGPWPDGLKS